MGSQQHGESLSARIDRRPSSSASHPGYAPPVAAPSARGLRRRQPACCTSAACAPRSSRGSMRGTTAGASCCASRTPTRRASTPRRSSRSSARCAGSGWTGTRARHRRRQRALHPERAATAPPRGRRAVPGRGQGLSLLLHDRGAGRGARGRAAGEPRLHLLAPVPRPERGGARRARGCGRALGDPAAHARRGRMRRRRPRAGRRALRVRAARRPRDRALRRRTDLQLREPDRRRRHAHHARDPRRGPAQLHAAAGARLRRARGPGALVRAPAAALRPRPQAPLQAPRSHERRGAAGGRLPGRGGRQLPGAARLALRLRARAVHARGADRAVLARAREPGARRSSTPRSSSG